MVYYRYKKERLSEKFNSAHEFLIKIRKAVQLYCLDPNEIIARGMTGYFSDFTEYIIDICETYLVINDRYNPRLSGVDLIKSATREGLMDDYLCEFLIKCIILRNRFTHDYYKRDIAEIENLAKGGPISFADYFISNNGTLKDYEIRLKEILNDIEKERI